MSLLLLFACAADEAPKAPNANFQGRESVRVLTPTNGESVESPFVLTWSAGADVAALHLEANGEGVVGATALDPEAGELVVELEPGRQELALVGEDADGAEIDRHALVVRVIDGDESWLTITSPSNGAVLPTPIAFTFEASDDVVSVDLVVDGEVVGEGVPGEVLSVAFDATGDAVYATAKGYDAAGELVATDAVNFAAEAGTEVELSDFNERVVDRLEGYPTDGSYGYYWPDDTDWYGTTQDIRYRGQLVAEGDSQHRSYCVGLTFEVLMMSFTELDEEVGGDGTFNDMTVDDLDTFRVDWFVRDLYGDGPGEALDNYGVGSRVTDWDDVRPGDFVQFWRHSGSGHNVIFVDWERDPEDDAIIGFRYWSTQGSTDGISYNEEYFGSSGSRVNPSYFYASRVAMPEDWLPW